MTYDERNQRIRKLYAQGLNDRQISEEVGISRYRVGELRNKMGLPPIKSIAPVRPMKVTDEQLAEWLVEGATVYQMAELSGAAYSTISKRLWKMRMREQDGVGRAAIEREAKEPAIDGDETFLAAFRPGCYAPPTHSRRAETSNRDGHIYGLPAPAFPVSSIYGA